MALVIASRVKETSTTTGTGTYTLAGAVTGFQSFAAIGDGNTTYYVATDGTDWEVGVGTYTSAGTTLARTQILASSNAGAAVNWAAGTRTIFCGLPAEKALISDNLATTTEVLTGTATGKPTPPNSIAALWEKGSDIASAGTISIGEGGYFHVTGTTTITDIDFATATNGRGVWLEFDGALTLTHNATTLKLPGGTNITTAAGDVGYFVQDSGDNIRCACYFRATATPYYGLVSASDVLTGTNTTRAVHSDAIADLWEKGSDVASAATVSLGTGGFFHITGTTTITDIDWATAKDGRAAYVVFDASLTLTHNATTLQLPGGANIQTAAGDRAIFIQDSSDNVICVMYQRAASLGTQGKFGQWIPGRALVPRVTNGGASGAFELATNDNTYATFDFDPTTQEYGEFTFAFPKRWDAGTVTFVVYWSHPSTATNFGVVFSLGGVSMGDSDPMDVAKGTVQTSTDTGGTTNDIFISPESSAITITAAAKSELVNFALSRVVGNASDTMAVDARVHGIMLFWTADAENDA